MKKSIIGILLCSILLLSACANGNSKENSKANSENKGENVSDNKKLPFICLLQQNLQKN